MNNLNDLNKQSSDKQKIEKFDNEWLKKITDSSKVNMYYIAEKNMFFG